MEDRQNIERLFKEALEHHEVDVRPEVWSSIQQSFAAQSSAASASAASGAASSVLTNVVAGIALAGLATVATINEVRYHEGQQSTVSATTESSIEEVKLPADQQQHASFDEQPENEGVQTTQRPQTEKVSPSGTTVESTTDKDAVQGAADEAPASTMAHTNLNDQAQGETREENAESQEAQATSSATTAQQLEESEAKQRAGDEPKANQTPAPKPAVAENEAPTIQGEESQKKTVARFTHDAVQTITPNGDMYNEYFQVEGQDVADFSIRIMTREGAVVFESRDINFQWNGLDRFGNPVPTGTYFYQIAAVGTDGLPYQEKNARGSIQVIRN